MSMKALVLHGKDGDYRYESEWKKPERPEKWLLIKVKYSGICGSDIPRLAQNGSYYHPIILGHEFSGIVAEADPDSVYHENDPVAVLPIMPCEVCENCMARGPFHCKSYQFIGSRNDGGFAEYCAVPEKNVLKLTSKDILKAGAFLEPMAVGLHTVRRSGFLPGKTAVVFGSGPIGLMIGLWLREFGGQRIIMADLREMNLRIAKDAGFEIADLSNKSISNLSGIDYAFEAAGSAKALIDAVDALNGLGTLAVVGRDVKDTIIPVDIFEKLMRKEVQMIGCWGYDMRGEHSFMARVLEKNADILERLITHEVEIENAVVLIGAMCEKKLEYCKVMIKF